MAFLLIVLSASLLFALVRPLTVLLHELGHAIPAIILTREKVSIFIGSHGDPSKSIHVNLGLLQIWFRYNFFGWRAGLCVPSAEDISINKMIIYTLMGPLTSFIVAVIAWYFAFSFNLHGFIKVIVLLFMPSALLDLIGNLIPNNEPTQLFNGKVVYNDGYSLRKLLFYKKLQQDYKEALNYYKDGKYKEAAKHFNKCISKAPGDEDFLRLAISSHLQLYEYDDAKELVNKLLLVNQMTSDDYATAGLVYSWLDLPDQAIVYYEKSLELNNCNLFSLNNKGYTLNLLGKYEEAIEYFDKAIIADEKFGHSYNNRGLAKIKTGKIQEGLTDIEYSLELDSGNSYSYRNLGIYHFDNEDFAESLRLFLKAKELDTRTHMIDDLISSAREKLKSR